MKIRNFLKNIFLIAILSAISLPVQAVEYTELQSQIDAKKKALEELEKQESVYNEQLSKTQQTKKTLNGELSKVKSELSGLNYKIKVTEAQIDKLILEMEKLRRETQDTENELQFNLKMLGQSVRSLYELDKNNGILSVLLTSNSLSESMQETENMMNYGKGIKDDLEKLRRLKNVLNDQKSETQSKKKEMEGAQNNLESRKTIVVSLQNEKSELLSKTKSQEKNYQNLLDSIEKKRAEIESEISILEEALKSQIDPSKLPESRNGILAWPANGRVTQGFGVTSDSKYFYKKGNYKTPTHNGIDIGISLGNPIYASEDGRVEAVGNQDKYCYKAAYGKFIVIKHNNNLTTLYAHLSLQSVKVGDSVKRGDLIGYSGNSGFSTGPHLHFTVYFTPTFGMNNSSSCGPTPIGAPVNPLVYL